MPTYSLKDAEDAIRRRGYSQAINVLNQLDRGIERDLLLAEAYAELDKTENAYFLLTTLFLEFSEDLQNDYRLRNKILRLLVQVTKTEDPEFYALIHETALIDQNIRNTLKAFYFGGALHRLTCAEKVIKKQKQINANLIRARTIDSTDYFIQFLKMYSSYTPLLQTTAGDHSGGGYFVCLNNYGLVIDPGHHFLDNFYKNGRSFDDIDGIAVTHFHDDHYADLPALLSLILQSGKYKRYKQKKFDLFLDKETYRSFKSLFQSSNRFKKMIQLKYYPYSQNKRFLLKKGIYLECLPAYHPSNIKHGCVGLLLTIVEKKAQLFITGDTGWRPELGKIYTKKKKYDYCILVAHISSINTSEVISYLRNKPDFYSKHLCIHGTLKVIECLFPTRVVLSEIGEELSPVIDDIAKLISNQYAIPCEIGNNGHIESV